VVTITTVGYGDMVPVTVAGRAMGFVLMFGGVAFFAAIHGLGGIVGGALGVIITRGLEARQIIPR